MVVPGAVNQRLHSSGLANELDPEVIRDAGRPNSSEVAAKIVHSERRILLIRVEQAESRRETLLLYDAELHKRVDEVRGEAQRLVAVDLLALPRLSRRARHVARTLWVLAPQQLFLGQLEHITCLDVGESALQRSERFRRVRPTVLFGHDRGRTQLDRAILHADFQLTSLADAEVTPYVGG